MSYFSGCCCYLSLDNSVHWVYVSHTCQWNVQITCELSFSFQWLLSGGFCCSSISSSVTQTSMLSDVMMEKNWLDYTYGLWGTMIFNESRADSDREFLQKERKRKKRNRSVSRITQKSRRIIRPHVNVHLLGQYYLCVCVLGLLCNCISIRVCV